MIKMLLTEKVTLLGLQFPEFSPTKRIDKKASAYIMDASHIRYDMIIGNDLLVPLGFDISPRSKSMEWQGHKVSWKPPSYLHDNPLPSAMSSETHAFFIDHTLSLDEYIDNFHQFESPIKESKYEYTATNETVEKQTHLSVAQRKQLDKVLGNFQPLFNGQLG